MQGWIHELKERALERGRGARPAALARVGELPPSLAALYRAMDGATLPGGVQLFPLEGLPPGGKGVAFGRRGKDRRLWAVRREDVYGLEPEGLIPAWVEAIEPGAWVFAAQGGGASLQVYSTLERMLAVLVPPTPSEDFGEHTFLRALNTVRQALSALKPKRAVKAERPATPKAKAKRAKGKPGQPSKPGAGRAASVKAKASPRTRSGAERAVTEKGGAPTKAGARRTGRGSSPRRPRRGR